MKIFCKIFVAVTLGVTITTSQVWAAESFGRTDHPMWVNIGVGAAANSDLQDRGAAGEISYNLMTTPNQLLTLKIEGGTDIFAVSYDNFSAMYGLIGKGDNGYVSASLGVGYTTMKLDIDFIPFIGEVSATRSAITANAEIQAFWTPTKNFGIGLIVPGFVGADHLNNIGAMLAIQIGKLK